MAQTVILISRGPVGAVAEGFASWLSTADGGLEVWRRTLMA